MPSENAELRKVGLKVTLPRVKIFNILENAKEHHLSAEDVYKKLLDQGDDVGLATVYRVLTQFETAGLVLRHNFEGGHAVFEMAGDDHHDHMVCTQTGEVIEFVDEIIEERQQKIAAEHGYEIVDHSLILYVKPLNSDKKSSNDKKRGQQVPAPKLSESRGDFSDGSPGPLRTSPGHGQWCARSCPRHPAFLLPR